MIISVLAHAGIAGYHRVVSVNTNCPRTCETILPCARTCSGNGKCLYGFCSCFVGYTGEIARKKCNLHETCKISEDPEPFFPSARKWSLDAINLSKNDFDSSFLMNQVALIQPTVAMC